MCEEMSQLVMVMIINRSSVIYEATPRTDIIWRSMFLMYWPLLDATSLLCCPPTPPPLPSTPIPPTKQSSTPLSSSPVMVSSTSTTTLPLFQCNQTIGNDTNHSWRMRFRRRAQVDRNWSEGRCHRQLLHIEGSSFVSVDSLNHQMIVVNESSWLHLYRRRTIRDAHSIVTSTVTPSEPVSYPNGSWYHARDIGSGSQTPYERPLAMAMNWSRGWIAILAGQPSATRVNVVITDIHNGRTLTIIPCRIQPQISPQAAYQPHHGNAPFFVDQYRSVHAETCDAPIHMHRCEIILVTK
jgi:hypothetical protein